MNYQEAFSYINSFTNYEKTPGLSQDLNEDGLERVKLLLRLLGRPQDSFKCIVVAGTKGKGSVSAMLESVLREAGYVTGLYTSPHLHTFRERIRVSGILIYPADMARITASLVPVIDRIKALGDPSLVPTTYEIATAIAFLYFKERGVEYAVLEVGLGGRLDAVNVTNPLVSVITSISMDHMEILGDTLGKIAAEKAGIIKPNGRVISAPQLDEAMSVISHIAERQNAKVTVIGREVYVGTGHLPEVISDDAGVPIYQSFTVNFEDAWGAPAGRLRIKLPLLGNHQQVNAAVALAALQILKEKGVNVTGEAILNGLVNVQWPGRLEVVHRNPIVVADGAHNVESIAKLGQATADLFPKQQVVVVLGTSREKDIPGILNELRAWTDGVSGPTVERLIITKSRHPRAADPREVIHAALALGLTVELRDDVKSALSRAESSVKQLTRSGQPEPLVLVTGSLFVVAEAREAYGLAPNLVDES